MCGRYGLIADIGELRERFDFDGSELTHAPRYNIAPTQMALAVTNGSERRGSYSALGPDTFLGQERIGGQPDDKRPR